MSCCCRHSRHRPLLQQYEMYINTAACMTAHYVMRPCWNIQWVPNTGFKSCDVPVHTESISAMPVQLWSTAGFCIYYVSAELTMFSCNNNVPVITACGVGTLTSTDFLQLPLASNAAFSSPAAAVNARGNLLFCVCFCRYMSQSKFLVME